VISVPGAEADACHPADQPGSSRNALTGDDLQALAEEQAALRRVAELVAAGASQPSVFDAVAHEACRLLGGHFTALLRYEPDGPAVIMAMWGEEAVRHVMHVGMQLSADGDGIVQRVRRTARAERIDDYARVPGANAATARDLGLTSGVGAPVITEGLVWGAITVLGSGPPLPAGAENRLEMFARLVATAIANTQARANLAALADHQTALLRVAERVARGAAPQEIFASVAEEASQLLDDKPMTLVRYQAEAELIVVASCGGPAPVGDRIEFGPETLPDRVRHQDRVVRIDDYSREPDSALASSYGLAAAVAAPISVQAEVWGMLVATSGERPLPAGTEHRLEQFAELVAAALANSQARADLQALADEQTALRRIAELTAREAPGDAVLNAVAVQASRLAGVEFGMVLRFEPDGTSEIVALDGAPTSFQVGMRAPDTGDGSAHRVWRTGRAARVENLGAMSGQWPRMASRQGFSASAGVPILLEGGLWGALIVAGREPMPAAIESHLADFSQLVSTAIAAAQARSALRRLADEQTALRRVAELVARGATLDEVFAAVAAEASKLLGDLAAVLLRFDADGHAVAVATCNSPVPLELRGAADIGTATGEVLRSGRAVRFDARGGTRPAGLEQPPGVQAGVAVPVTVEGRAWGALATSTPGPPDAEDRLSQLAELAAAAIANAENKAKLTASRARVIATTDETRRRLQRDLHDGAQQRLVHAIISLKLARDTATDPPTALLIEEALVHAQRANAELRDLVHGIMPAALTRGGLRAGLESLVADLTLPIDLHVTVPRLHPQLETTAYFIVAEALTNVVKHAHATRATVNAVLDDDKLTIVVQDDGRGGADPTRGTGLTGLLDRVEASEGELSITSPPGRGTVLRAELADGRPTV
jgi:signal transduction histidine kinase